MKLKLHFLFGLISLVAGLQAQTLVKEFTSGPGSGMSLPVQSAATAMGELYFTFPSPSNGVELFRTNGTGPGTNIVSDLDPGWGSGVSRGIRNFNGKLLLVGQPTGTSWYSYYCGSYCCSYSSWSGCRGYCSYYCSGSYYWSNGNQYFVNSLGNLQMLSGNSVSNYVSGAYTNPGDTLGGFLYYDEAAGSGDQELYRVPLNASSTRTLVSNINSGGSSNPKYFTQMGGKIYFNADNGTNGAELWSTDGTTTTMVKDINTGAAASAPENLRKLGNLLIFTADDGVNGRELWVSDGTASGTVMLKDINTAGASSPAQLVVSGSYLYFIANSNTTGTELWRTDGTSSGTILLSDFTAGTGSSSISDITPVGTGVMYISTNYLMSSDGSTSGTDTVFRINGADLSMQNDYGQTQATYSNGMLYFAASRFWGGKGWELWNSNGSGGSTSVVVHFNGSQPDSVYQVLGVLGTDIFLRAASGGLGTELYSFSLQPLNTTLLSFTGVAAEHSNQLSWKTASYTDVTEFVVEKQVAEEKWQKIGIVRPNHSFLETNAGFQLMEQQPDEGTTVYRLSEVNSAGKAKVLAYTTVSRAALTTADENRIFPNPADDFLYVRLQEGETVSVWSINGSELKSLQNTDGSLCMIETAHLHPGIYLIRIHSEQGSSEVLRFVKR